MINDIWVIGDKKEEKFLRKKTADFDFKKFTKKEVAELVSRMRRIMRAANGIGLSANQIGLDLNMFVAEVPDVDQGGTKFYAIFNPKIEKKSGETAVLRGRMPEHSRKMGLCSSRGTGYLERLR